MNRRTGTAHSAGRRRLSVRLAWLVARAARDLGRYPIVALLLAAGLAWPLLGRWPAATMAAATVVAIGRARVLATRDDWAGRMAARLLAALTAVVAAAAGWVWWQWGHGSAWWLAAWLAAVAAVVVATDTPRRRARVVRRVREAIAEATGAPLHDVQPCTLPRPQWGAHWWRWDRPERDRLDRIDVRWVPGLAGARPGARNLVAAVISRELGPDVGVSLATARRRLLIERAPQLPTEVATTALMMGGADPRVPVVAVGAAGRGLPTADDGTPLLMWHWDRDYHALVVGVTGGGKTSVVGGIIRTALLSGTVAGVTIVDGKQEGDYARWTAREHVTTVATDPEGWKTALLAYQTAADQRHADIRAWREDGAPEPAWHKSGRRWLLVVDELDAVIEGVPGARELLTLTLKTVRSVGGRVLVITQRPDISTSLPGSARDQLAARIVAGGPGALSGTGWTMAMGEAADTARRRMGAAGPDGELDALPEMIPGRVVMLGGGRVEAGQAPWLPDPLVVPAVEAFMPPRRDAPPADARPRAEVIPIRPPAVALDHDPAARMKAAKAALIAADEMPTDEIAAKGV